MIEFKKKGNSLICQYTPEFDIERLAEKLSFSEEVTISNTFTVLKSNLDYDSDDSEYNDFKTYSFVLGELYDGYYKLNKSILSTENSFFFNADIDFKESFFIVKPRTSILKLIDSFLSEDVYIGDSKKDNFPFAEFLNLISKFPSLHEINLYRKARVTSVIGNYFDGVKDVLGDYNKYLNKKTQQEASFQIIERFSNYEIDKYRDILERLTFMLANEDKFNEGQWQNEILQVILLIFPKYVKVIKEVKFSDTNNIKRRLDFGLIDFDGNLDLVEIKKPFGVKVMTQNTYRDNYIAARELVGSIMQIEKYIFYLNKSGNTGENKLNEKYSKDSQMKLKINNPKGIIILGRSKGLTEQQIADFEVVKRKYNNIADILTYDDLINRLTRIINTFEVKFTQ